jgi:hypothetical protein
MILVARTRGNGVQLGKYLMNSPANDNAVVFDIRGTLHTDDIHLSLRDFSLKGQLTKSKKEIFHLVINPPQDVKMSAEDWLTCTKIVEKHLLPFAQQPRAMVLHQKGHVHMHVAYSRVGPDGKLIPDKFFKLALSKARREIEITLDQKLTPFRNQKKDIIKETLTELWRKTRTGQEFIDAALQAGYQVVRSNSRRPFMVVDKTTGQSVDLIRQLKGVKTKDVRERLQGCGLQLDKDVIRSVRIELDPGYFDRLQDNALEAILQQKQKYDERQEEVLRFNEKMAAKKLATKEITESNQDTELSLSQKRVEQLLNQYRDRQAKKQARKSLDKQSNGKLENALQQLKLALDEADTRQKQKDKGLNMGM